MSQAGLEVPRSVHFIREMARADVLIADEHLQNGNWTLAAYELGEAQVKLRQITNLLNGSPNGADKRVDQLEVPHRQHHGKPTDYHDKTD